MLKIGRMWKGRRNGEKERGRMKGKVRVCVCMTESERVRERKCVTRSTIRTQKTQGYNINNRRPITGFFLRPTLM